MSVEDVTKRCYICNQYFDDRVKLGMHISACYDEAVNVRKELWHPHPLDLVDQQHYTQYMANKHHYTIEQMKDAKRRGISFVTADSFDAIKGHLPAGGGGGGGGGARQPSSTADGPHSRNVAQPARTGVTLLKNELSSELQKLRSCAKTKSVGSQSARTVSTACAAQSKANLLAAAAAASYRRRPTHVLRSSRV